MRPWGYHSWSVRIKHDKTIHEKQSIDCKGTWTINDIQKFQGRIILKALPDGLTDLEDFDSKAR